jgi:hypothetical protein
MTQPLTKSLTEFVRSISDQSLTSFILHAKLQQENPFAPSPNAHKLSSATSYNTAIMSSSSLSSLMLSLPVNLASVNDMSSSTLSSFMLSLPINLAVVSDNAKTASHPATPPAEKPVKACRCSETKASPKAPSRAPRRTSLLSCVPAIYPTRAC